MPWVIDERTTKGPAVRIAFVPSAKGRREVPSTYSRVVLLTTDEGVPNQYWSNFCKRMCDAINREFGCE